MTYVTDDSLPDGQYYLYLFNNNLGYSESRPDYDWSQIDQIATDLFRERLPTIIYKVDENVNLYLVQFSVPFSGYVRVRRNVRDTILCRFRDAGTDRRIQGRWNAGKTVPDESRNTISTGCINMIFRISVYRISYWWCEQQPEE